MLENVNAAKLRKSSAQPVDHVFDAGVRLSLIEAYEIND
jgi:hypothetical protein